MSTKCVMLLDGPGNLAAAYQSWRAGEPDPTQMDATFSGQFFDVVTRLGLRGHAIAWPGGRMRIREGPIVVEHRPPPSVVSGALRFQLADARWATELAAIAIAAHVDVILLASGPNPVLFAPLRAANVRLVPVLHNTLWPRGNPPSTALARARLAVSGWFFRHVADTTLAVSPECELQVRTIAPTLRGPIRQFRPSYRARLAPPREEPSRIRFQVLYAGRIERGKGVLDLVDIAALLERRIPGRFRWVICGAGLAVDEMRERIRARNLEAVVEMRGRLGREALAKEYIDCDAVIVPTSASFSEGMARVALEAALAGRPCVLSSCVPAADVLRGAAVVVTTGDIDGYAAALLRLAEDAHFYRQTARATDDATRQFLDPAMSFATVLEECLRIILEL